MCHRYPAGAQRAVTEPSAAYLGWVERKFEVNIVVNCFSQTKYKQQQGSTLKLHCADFGSVLFTNNGGRGEPFKQDENKIRTPLPEPCGQCLSRPALLQVSLESPPGGLIGSNPRVLPHCMHRVFHSMGRSKTLGAISPKV